MSARVRCAAVVVAAAALAAAVAAAGQQRQRPVFRAVGALVTVEVQVRDGNRLVPGLTAADFEVRDKGVPQTVEMLDVESLPIDLTLVVDVSGSVRPIIEELRVYTRESAAALRVDDRFRLITFSSEIREITPLMPAAEAAPVETIAIEAATSIVDAAVAALLRTRERDRRQIVVLFTDGMETNSALDVAALDIVAKRSDTVLHVFIVRQPMADWLTLAWHPANSRWHWLSRVEMPIRELSAAAHATGGALQVLNVRTQLPALLRRTLEEFRTSYVLRYAPTGVASDGWHTIDVRAKGHTVRARPGYFAGR